MASLVRNDYIDLSDLYVDLSVIYVDVSNHYVELSKKKKSSKLVALYLVFTAS